MVQGQKSGKWGWTKGHRESRDRTWFDTAIRETYEESGLLLGKDYWICGTLPEQWGKRVYWQGITYSLMIPAPTQDIRWVPLSSLADLSLTNDVEEWLLYSRRFLCDFEIS